MSTISSYDVVGVAEDISDVISNISPTSTPFQQMIGAESIHQKVFQWQEDSLMSVSVTPTLEGANAPAANFQSTVMRQNTTQIFTATASTTGTMDKTKTYGRAQELAYQLGLRSKELKRNLEYAFVGTAQGYVQGSTGTPTLGSDTVARQFVGYQGMIDPSVVYTMGEGLSYSGTLPARSPITETAVLIISQQMYLDGADPNTIMVKPQDSLNISKFSANGRTVFQQAEDKKLVNVINVYESPFGNLKVVMNRFLRGAGSVAGEANSDALVFESDMWKKTPFRPWFRKTLAVTGDATNVQILGEYGLKHRNFKASGLITNLA